MMAGMDAKQKKEKIIKTGFPPQKRNRFFTTSAETEIVIKTTKRKDFKINNRAGLTPGSQ